MKLRFTRPLEDLLRGPTHVRTLRVLLRFPAKEFTGREIARAARVSPPSMNRVLRSLRSQGVVRRREAGRSHLWSLNQRHCSVRALNDLYAFERGVLPHLKSVLRSALRRAPVTSAVIFGSAARGEERSDSDVDLMIEVAGEPDRRAVERLLPSIEREVLRVFGNPLAALVYTTGNLRRPRNPELIHRVREEGVPVLGRREGRG